MHEVRDVPVERNIQNVVIRLEILFKDIQQLHSTDQDVSFEICTVPPINDGKMSIIAGNFLLLNRQWVRA